MSFEEDFADLLVEDASDCEDHDFNLRQKSKKQKPMNSFIFKASYFPNFISFAFPSFSQNSNFNTLLQNDEEKTIMKEVCKDEKPAKKRRKGKNKKNAAFAETCKSDNYFELLYDCCCANIMNFLLNHTESSF